MIASGALPPPGKKTLLKTSVAAVPYRKNSYHSTTVPAIEAPTTFFSPDGGAWLPGFGMLSTLIVDSLVFSSRFACSSRSGM